MSQHILILVGPSGSGKSTGAKMLEEVHGYRMFEASEPLRREVPLHLPQPERLAAVEQFLLAHGRDFLGRYIAKQVQAIRAKDRRRLVVSGLRTVEEVEAIRETFPARVVAVEASFELRIARLRARRRDDLSESREAFVRLSAWEYSLGLARLVFGADEVVINDGTVEELHRRIEAHISPSDHATPPCSA